MDKKKDSQSQQSDIHFIVDLPMELVVDHLRNLDYETYHVELKKIDADESSFWISNKQHRDLFMVKATGKVQRWNGTFTRLDADISHVNTAYKGLNRSRLLIWALPILGITFSLSAYNVIAPKLAFLLGTLGIFLLISGLPIFFIMQIVLDMWNINIDKKKAKNLNTHRALIKNLKNDLKEDLKAKAKVMQFDGTDDELTSLLRQEEYKHFQLAEDGEISEASKKNLRQT